MILDGVMSEYHQFQKDAFIQNADISKQAPCLWEIIKVIELINNSHFYDFLEVKDAFYDVAIKEIIRCLSKDKRMANAIANKYKQINGNRISVDELKELLESKKIDEKVCYQLFGFVVEEFG